MLELLRDGGLVLLGALAAAWVALGRYRAERHFDRRYDAYIHVLNSLHVMAKSFADTIDDDILNRPPSPEREKAAQETYDQGKREIDRHIDVGTLLLSEGTLTALKSLRRELNRRHESYVQELADGYSALRTCIDEVRKEAHRDLRLDPFWNRHIQPRLDWLRRARPRRRH